jgi:hypothetical protein
MTRTSIKTVIFSVCLSAAAGHASAESRPSSAPATSASAETPAQVQQALSDCLVDSVSEDDKRALVKWIFAMLARHPDVKPLSDINAAQDEKIVRDASAVFETLMADKCAAQLRAAVRKSGTDAVGKSFERLGETATGALLQDPNVMAGVAGLMKHADTARIERAIMGK